VTAELPELGESLTWSQLEAWAVAMREELPAAALAAALEELQDRLIARVCGPKWLPDRDLPAPSGAPPGGRQINSKDTQTSGSVVSKSQAAGRQAGVSQSYESPVEPTEATAPASARRAVYRTATYWDPLSE
jgi:hypothetical protein